MATWQQFDGLESRMAKAGAEAGEFLSHLRSCFPGVDAEHHERILGPLQELTDRMREARTAARDAVVAERGYRR